MNIIVSVYILYYIIIMCIFIFKDIITGCLAAAAAAATAAGLSIIYGLFIFFLCITILLG